LAQLWLDSEDRLAINRASNDLDTMLRDEPLLPRFELVEGKGTAVQPLLGIDFQVSIGNRSVLVFAVWLASVDTE